MTAFSSSDRPPKPRSETPGASIDVRTWLAHPHEDGPQTISSLVQTWLRRRRQDLFSDKVEDTQTSQGHYWDASFFRLQNVHLFQCASAETQHRILRDCSLTVLHEAICIEQAGIAFAAKMCLVARDSRERQLYGVFAADEVAHLQSLRPFMPAFPISERGDFLDLLSAVIETGSRPCLQYVVQVVLEGWGLTHYRLLRDACINVNLKHVFDRILADEAAHHGSGIALLDEGDGVSACETEILSWMRRFLSLVQLGPISTLGVLERHWGGLDSEGRQRTLREMGATEHSASRLALLRDLMRKPCGGEGIVTCLEHEGAFRPWKTTDLV